MAMRKKSAILVGCGYYGNPNERYGCENDVRTIEEVLLNKFGFHRENIKQLIETTGSTNQPTKENIQNLLRDMNSQAGKGDVLFFYFSGVVNVNPSNNIRGIVCSDLHEIPATDFQSQANQLPDKTSFTLVLESSHSAGFIDPVGTDDNRILFSACQENETPRRVDPGDDKTSEYGAFTNAIQMALRDHPPPITNEELLGQVNTRIIDQHAGLHCNTDNRKVNFLEYLTIN